MFTNVNTNCSTSPLRNTLPRVTIKDNPICLEEPHLTGSHFNQSTEQIITAYHHHQPQSSHLDVIHRQAGLTAANQGSSCLIYTQDSSNQVNQQQHSVTGLNENTNQPFNDLVSLSTSTLTKSHNWKRLTVYIVLIVILLLVIVNGTTTIWIMAQISFSTNGMGSLSIDSQSIQLNGQAYFLGEVFSPEISSPKDKRIRISSKSRTELGLKNGQGNVVNKLHLTRSSVVAVTDQLTIKNHLGKTLLSLDDSELKLSPTRLKITGSKPVELQGSIQTASVKCSQSSFPDLSISSLTRGILIRGISHVNMDANMGLTTIESLKDLKFISTARKIHLNSTWIVMDNLKTVIASRSGRSYPNILSLCACPNGNLFLSSSNNQCNAHDTICGNHYSFNDQSVNNNLVTSKDQS